MKTTLIRLAALVSFGSLCYGETIYFLLGPDPRLPAPEELERLGSVVIPLSDPLHIAHARGLLNHTVQTSRRVLMRIRAGKNGINRNYYAPGWPEWSWHPFEVTDFGDIISAGSEWTPIRLETTRNWSEPDAWEEERGVGFPSFTVVRELGPAPVVLSVIRDGT